MADRLAAVVELPHPHERASRLGDQLVRGGRLAEHADEGGEDLVVHERVEPHILSGERPRLGDRRRLSGGACDGGIDGGRRPQHGEHCRGEDRAEQDHVQGVAESDHEMLVALRRRRPQRAGHQRRAEDVGPRPPPREHEACRARRHGGDRQQPRRAVVRDRRRIHHRRDPGDRRDGQSDRQGPCGGPHQPQAVDEGPDGDDHRQQQDRREEQRRPPELQHGDLRDGGRQGQGPEDDARRPHRRTQSATDSPAVSPSRIGCRTTSSSIGATSTVTSRRR